jgi:hypothetical protein
MSGNLQWRSACSRPAPQAVNAIDEGDRTPLWWVENRPCGNYEMVGLLRQHLLEHDGSALVSGVTFPRDLFSRRGRSWHKCGLLYIMADLCVTCYCCLFSHSLPAPAVAGVSSSLFHEQKDSERLRCHRYYHRSH